MKKYFFFLLLFIPNIVLASEITSQCTITSGDNQYSQITDGDFITKVKFSQDETIDISCDKEASYIYINYDGSSSLGTLSAKNSYSLGTKGYLHELVKIEPNAMITLEYKSDYTISDIYVFDTELPDWVQDWQTLDSADLMLFSTHSDDEQLFFAGLLPTYVDRGKKIMVVYYTNHYDNISRYHELLNGLWTLGVKYYPEISVFPDKYSETLEDALVHLNSAGYTEEDAIKFQVDMIRKYKPRVVVGHDEKGEYSHGQHILNTYTLKKAITLAADTNYVTTNNYNAYQIDKLYLHLYEKNPIVMNYDVPLTAFGGKTAYEVAKEGYSHHLSQQYTWFTAWLVGNNNEFTKMTDIAEYSPCNFGLYYTNVGDDINKNDMFENISDKTSIPDKETNDDDNVIKVKNDVKDFEFKFNKKILLGISLMLTSGTAIIYLIRKIKKAAK